MEGKSCLVRGGNGLRTSGKDKCGGIEGCGTSDRLGGTRGIGDWGLERMAKILKRKVKIRRDYL